MRLADRVARAEHRARSLAGPVARWIRVIWQPGEPWQDALGRSDYAPGDSVILRRVIDAKDAQPVADAIHDRDMPLADRFLAGAAQ
ncbi:MAG: hypothetical protein KJ755_16315 [Alphaproteobacteria bacterium]|nr:hypothetical protein [Alphaproteobacteria bacterium]